MFDDTLLPSAPASTLPTPSLIISVLYSWKSGYQVVMRLPCTQQVVSHRTCLRTIFSLSWIFSMHSIAYTEISCWKESVRWFQSSTNFVIWRIVVTLFSNLAIFLFHWRRIHNRVIHLGGFFLLGHTSKLTFYCLFPTMFHLGHLCPPYSQMLTSFVEREPKQTCN